MTPTEQDKKLRELYKQVRNNSRVILYTDVMGRPDEDGYREQVSRDDMWAISTAELDKFVELITADRKRVALEARIDELENHGNWANERAWRKKRISELKEQYESIK